MITADRHRARALQRFRTGDIVFHNVTRTAAIIWRKGRARTRAATEIAAAVRRHCRAAGLKMKRGG